MLAGIIIWTENLKEMSEFYSLILDVNPNNANKSHVSFHFNDLKLIIGTHDKVEGKAKDKYRKMINFSVDDIQNSYRKLLSLNVKIIKSPYKENWGGYICTFEDYDENIIQFIQSA
tara:strand:+ start:119 stop:466 length:348 start_codon:yes stop_codon:yes gene_type:complete